MIFNYQATNKDGQEQTGTVEAPNVNLAIASLQRRGLIIVDIVAEGAGSWLTRLLSSSRVKTKDVVMLSRQIATLFEAKVSALATFRMLAAESENPNLRRVLTEITDDIKAGMPISDALGKHPKVFSDFYVHMVAAGEESGKISDNFNYLADYLERAYELSSKARNALIYPAFIILSFVGVMILMLTFVIPRLTDILKETGQVIPIYTKIVIGVSDFFVNYGIFLFILLVILAVFTTRYIKTAVGKTSLSRFKLAVPYIGNLYRKIYLSRIADNLSTMLTSGISMVRAIEITSEVVDNEVYRGILIEAGANLKSGSLISAVMYKYHEIPTIMVQMMKVGEETGKLGFVLQTLSRFYRREVENEIKTLVDLIEPAMIVVLGVMVGILLTSVLMPIYNLAQGI
ncbi:MAG TPA: type II secretion system F family protein [Candidatus Paceibacterota bacterium]